MHRIWLASVAALAVLAPAAYADMPGKSISKTQMQKEQMRTETLRRDQMRTETMRDGEMRTTPTPETMPRNGVGVEQRAELKTDAKHDMAFVSKALKSGREEVALSQLVSEKTSNA